ACAQTELALLVISPRPQTAVTCKGVARTRPSRDRGDATQSLDRRWYQPSVVRSIAEIAEAVAAPRINQPVLHRQRFTPVRGNCGDASGKAGHLEGCRQPVTVACDAVAAFAIAALAPRIKRSVLHCQGGTVFRCDDRD